MPATVQDVIDAAFAQELAADKALFTADKKAVLTFVRAHQARVYARLARWARSFYTRRYTQASTVGSANRTVDLAIPPAGETVPERTLQVFLPSGAEVHLAFEDQLDEHLAPRAFLRGTVLHEVAAEWGSPGTSVDLTLLVVRGPTLVDPAGDYAQAVDLPDAWTWPIVHELSGWAAVQDERLEKAQFWFNRAERALRDLAEHLRNLEGDLTGVEEAEAES